MRDGMLRLREVMGGRGRGGGQALPVAPLLEQAVIAEEPKQDIVGPRLLGVQLEPVALEPLCEVGMARIPADLIRSRGDR